MKVRKWEDIDEREKEHMCEVIHHYVELSRLGRFITLQTLLDDFGRQVYKKGEGYEKISPDRLKNFVDGNQVEKI